MSEPELRPSYRLENLISPDAIRVKIRVQDWEDATELAGSLLTDMGVTLPDYAVAMKRVLKEMGPYVVIAPGIALLHARPEDGVLKPSLALITLAEGVNFGHTENDPVDLVFALAATDKTSHIYALQELAEFLSNEEALAKLRAAQSKEEILSLFYSL